LRCNGPIAAVSGVEPELQWFGPFACIAANTTERDICQVYDGFVVYDVFPRGARSSRALRIAELAIAVYAVDISRYHGESEVSRNLPSGRGA